MSKFAVPLILFALFFSVPCFSEDTCNLPPSDKKPVVVRVEGSMPAYRLRHELPIPEIRELEREKGYDNADRTLGFTSYETKNEVSLGIRFLKSSDEEIGCAWLSELTTAFSVTLVDVFVPSEYRPGTCPYEQIKIHEEQHVQILRETHSEFLEGLKQMLERGSFHDSSSPITADSTAAAKAEISSEIERAINDFLKDFSDTLAARQRAIDTPENYAFIHSKCTEW